MPYPKKGKKERKDKLKLGFKKCLFCGKKIELKIRRDLWRKRFCSISCRSKYNYRTGKIPKPPKPTKKSRKKAGLKMRGEKHWKWIKNRIKLKKKRFNNSERESKAETWRKDIFERDNYICQICGIRGGKLNAHHIKSWSNFPKLRFELSNGVTLCQKCHKLIHKNNMPLPHKGESQKKYVNRAIQEFMDEGYGIKEALGRAYGFYKHYSGKWKKKKKKK